MGVFRAGITDRVELREGGEQRPAAREEGRAWRLGVRWRGGTASEMRLGDLRRLGAELGASSSPSADGDKGLGLPRSRHSREDQNCGFLERFGAGGGGSRGPTSPHRVSGTSPVGGAQEKHSQATQIRQNLHPHSLTSGLLTGHGRSPRPPAVPRFPEGRASVSYTSLISKGRINDFHTGKTQYRCGPHQTHSPSAMLQQTVLREQSQWLRDTCLPSTCLRLTSRGQLPFGREENFILYVKDQQQRAQTPSFQTFPRTWQKREKHLSLKNPPRPTNPGTHQGDGETTYLRKAKCSSDPETADRTPGRRDHRRGARQPGMEHCLEGRTHTPALSW